MKAKYSQCTLFSWILLLLLSLGLQSCYTFSSTSLPKHIRSLQIHDVENKTADPFLAEKLKQSFRTLFQKQASGVRLVNEDADADFFLTLTSYSNRVENVSTSSDVETYRVNITVNVLFKDNQKKEIIYQGKNLSGAGVYDVSLNESEELHGQTRAMENLQQLVINNAMSDW